MVGDSVWGRVGDTLGTAKSRIKSAYFPMSPMSPINYKEIKKERKKGAKGI